jgi:hypothetical protein
VKEQQVARGVPLSESYSMTIYLMLGVLLIGFIANRLVKPLPLEPSPQTKLM